MDNKEIEKRLEELKRIIGGDNTEIKSETSVNNRYQYGYVELEEVMKNPDEYIIPACQPACMALWKKNIETFMVSNNDNENLFVELSELSKENIAILQELSEFDPRYYYDGERKRYVIRVKGMDIDSMMELESLIEVFKMQDTVKYETVQEFLGSYKTTDGEYITDGYGNVIITENPAFATAKLEEALKKTGKEHLYVAEEGRIYESPIYLKWHLRYLQYLQNEKMKSIENAGKSK